MDVLCYVCVVVDCQVRMETDEGREQRAGQEVSLAGVGDCVDSTTKDNER